MAIIHKDIQKDRDLLEANDEDIQQIFENSHTVAIIGAATKAGKPGYDVPHFLKENGYLLMPITSRQTELMGEKTYPALEDVTEQIDIVLTFRPSGELPNLVKRAATCGVKAVWSHEGVSNLEAAKMAKALGLQIVMNKSMRREFCRWFRD